MTEAKDDGIGMFGIFGILVGGGCLLFALVGAVNTAFDLDLAMQVSGTSTKLPNHWDETLGLAAVGAIIVGLTLFGGLVRRQFAAAKGRPFVRFGILAGAAGIVGLVARGLMIAALLNTYGSMLAYYACDGDLEDVKAELAKRPDAEALDNAVSRAAQYDNEAALALLLAAGADMRDATSPEQYRRCALVGKSFEFVKTALDHGVKPDACPRGEAAIWEAIRHGRDDAEVARTVTLLRAAGWSADSLPEFDERSARALAEEKKWPLTLTALGG
jgi:hypothetical protein